MTASRSHHCSDCGSSLYSHEVNWGMGRGLCIGCLAIAQKKEEEKRDTVECARCFRKTRSWNRETWRDGRDYCKDCHEHKETVWTAENTCMLCGELLKECAKKVKPPKRIQEGDEYVKNGLVKERFVCYDCFVKHAVGAGRSIPVVTPEEKEEKPRLGGRVAEAITGLAHVF